MREYESEDPDLAALTSDNPELAALRNQLNSLQTQRAELASKFGEHHPRCRDQSADRQGSGQHQQRSCSCPTSGAR